ncbi:MAG TPA: GNAT family N-acetyltransferase [Burkholderiales bacterium]|nr:GNAT family N-acetyltransferase [Burkholderiales bacterium]
MPAPAFVVRPVNWLATREKLRMVRRAVFIEEQRVPEELEWDELDEHAYHVLASSGTGEPIGTGRLILDGRIGRMAVAREWRGRGVGAAILQTLIDLARREGLTCVRLHAQTHALGFYARYGFVASGEEFDEAGIAHRAMEITLAS